MTRRRKAEPSGAGSEGPDWGMKENGTGTAAAAETQLPRFFGNPADRKPIGKWLRPEYNADKEQTERAAACFGTERRGREDAMMEVDTKGELSLKKIAESGQTFRWREESDGWWRIAAFDRVLRARQDGRMLTLACTREEYETVWRSYFDLDTDYAAIRRTIPAEDAYLTEAAARGKGIQILRQDPWEMTVTFIISQRKNIPAIRTCVEKLCRMTGRRLRADSGPLTAEKASGGRPGSGTDSGGEAEYCFPTPEEILRLRCSRAEGRPEGEEPLCSFRQAGFDSCSLGYRMPYIRAAAEWARDRGGRTAERPDPESLREGNGGLRGLEALSDGELMETLLGIRGVGVKVASCIMLFGFHRLNAFPVDVWMKRALETHYPQGFSLSSYAPYAGVMQQYMFCEERRRHAASGSSRKEN